jgi:hydrogenase/urease accessory protein HupE
VTRHVAVLGCLIIARLLLGANVWAHEVRPAYLEITQPDATGYDIVWKQPMMGEVAVHLVPHLSNGWLERPPAQQYAAGGFLIRNWKIDAGNAAALAGTSIEIEGLADTITDVFVRIRLSGGTSIDTIIRPEAPRLAISSEIHQHLALPAYLLLGIEHILTGPDHLLFVLGLVLIVRSRSMLLKTVSAFTLAHSITLAAAIVGKVRLPTSFVETLISLSILLLAPEILRVQRGESSLTVRYPWAVAFVFGLFHGMGFASGLASLGFQSHDLFSALVLFNLGVEVGQLAFIALVLSIGRALRPTLAGTWSAAAQVPAYVVGVAGAYWTIQCGAVWLGRGL